MVGEAGEPCVAMRWCQWSRTRFGKVRHSAALFICSLSMGLDGMVDLVVADDDISNYYINGYQKNGPSSEELFRGCVGGPYLRGGFSSGSGVALDWT